MAENTQAEVWDDAKALNSNNQYVVGISKYHDGRVGVRVSKNATMAYTTQIIQCMGVSGSLESVTRYTDLDYHEFWFEAE